MLSRILTAFLLTVPTIALAQSPGASESSTEPAIGQMISSSPQPGERGVQGTVGFQLQDGPTSTKGFSGNLIIAHTRENRDLARFDLEIAHAYYKPSATAEYIKVEGNYKATNTYMHFFKKRWAVTGAAYYRRDEVIKLDYRAAIEGGIGAMAVDSKRVKATLGVGYAVGRQSRSYEPEATSVLAVGFMDSLSIIVSPVARIEQWFQYHVDTSRSADKTYSFNTSFMTRVTKHAGLKVYYQGQYDSLHPATVPETQHEFGVGLTISFQPPPRGTAKP